MKKFFLYILVTFILIPQISSAYQIDPKYAPDTPFTFTSEDQEVEYGVPTIIMIIQIITGSILTVAAGIAIYFIAMGGFQYVTAMGKSENMEKAKKTLIWAVLGLVAIIFAFIIVRTVINLVLTVEEEPAPQGVLSGPEITLENTAGEAK